MMKFEGFKKKEKRKEVTLSILTERKRHMIVSGGPGSGKTTCVTIPVMREWPGTIFAIDPTGELYNGLTEEQKTRTRIFRPTEEFETCGFDVFYLAKIHKKRNEILQDMNNIAYDIIPLNTDKNDYIKDFAREILAGILLYGFLFKKYGFIEIMLWIRDNSLKSIINEISECIDHDCSQKVKVANTLADDVLGTVFGCLMDSIRVYTQDDMIRNAFLKDGEEGLDPNYLEIGANIFCQIPDAKLDNWKPALQLLIKQYIRYFYERQNDCKYDVLFVPQDCWLLGDIGLPKAMATMRGKRVYFLIDTYSMESLNVIYGNEGVEIMECNTHYRLYASEKESKWDGEAIKNTDFYNNLLLADRIQKTYYDVNKDKMAWYKQKQPIFKFRKKDKNGAVEETGVHMQKHLMIKCEHCGELVPYGQYCFNCGKILPHILNYLPTMTCKVCGGKLPKGNYCVSCGGKQEQEK